MGSGGELEAAFTRNSSRKPLIRSVALYFLIACGWAWVAWSPVVLGTDGLNLIHLTASLPVFSCVATLGPFFACFISYRSEYKSWHAVRLLPGSALRATWLLLGPMLVLTCMFVVFPALISEGSPRDWHWHPRVLLGIWLPMFNYNLLGGPLFEEFGWRGYLQARLQNEMAPWLASVFVGLLWTVWHLPLFLVSWTSANPPTFAFILVGLSVLMGCAFNSSGGAVVVAILMHAAFNASSQFLGPFLGKTPGRDHPSAEFLVGLSFWMAAVAAVVLTRGRLGASVLSREWPDSVSTNDKLA